MRDRRQKSGYRAPQTIPDGRINRRKPDDRTPIKHHPPQPTHTSARSPVYPHEANLLRTLPRTSVFFRFLREPPSLSASASKPATRPAPPSAVPTTPSATR